MKALWNNKCRDSATASKKLKPELKEKWYSEDEVRDAIVFSIYESESKFDGEYDFLIVLPNKKCIINVEVKNNRDKNSKNSNLRSAASQMKDHAAYMAKIHGIAISEDWSFVKCAAIMPHVVDSSKICDHCKSFIVTEDYDVASLWNNLSFIDLSNDSDGNKNLLEEFSRLFERLVNFSSTTRHSISGMEERAWKQVQGGCSSVVSAGFTPSNSSTPSLQTFDDIRKIAHDASKILYFNYDQIGLLMKRLLIFLCDFGSGMFYIKHVY